MNFSLPPDTIAYEEDPTAVAALLKDSNYSAWTINKLFSPPGQPTTGQAAIFTPRCWQTLRGLFHLWYLLPTTSGRAGPGGGAILFLHERVSASGNRRIVCVAFAQDMVTFQRGFVQGYQCHAFAMSPATWTSSIAAEPQDYNMYEIMYSVPMKPRVYAGRADPSDPSHFTIRYQMWGLNDVLDGRLQNDDRVTLTPRDLRQWFMLPRPLEVSK